MSFESDADRLAIISALGGVVFEATRGSFIGLLDKTYFGVPGGEADIASSAPRVTCRTSDIELLQLQPGEDLRSLGVDYTLAALPEDDGAGMSVLQVHLG